MSLKNSLDDLPKFPDNKFRQNFVFKKFGNIGKCAFDNKLKYNSNFYSNIPYVVVASIVAYIGLAKNDSTIIIASMLLSPLGGQIIRSAIGILKSNAEQFSIGIINHLLYVVLIFIIGFVLGLILDEKTTMGKKNNGSENIEMMGRGTWTDSTQNIIFSVLLAVLSGILLSLSANNEDSSVMVGIGIGAALLPPIVNSGMFAGFAAKGFKDRNYLELSGKSMSLWLLNYIVIIFTMIATFKFGCN
jgi:uncharacterized membrane protein